LACLFSPKVYIILIHPEKNMRLTKQLKAQSSSFKFTSHIPTTTNCTSNDLSSSEGPSKSIVSNDNEENAQSLVSKKSVSFKSTADECKNNDKTTNNNKHKIPTIITTSHSENCCLNNEKHKLKSKKYTYDDDDSLDSNQIHGEEIML